jgi:hypothetical protein
VAGGHTHAEEREYFNKLLCSTWYNAYCDSSFTKLFMHLNAFVQMEDLQGTAKNI